MASKMSRERAVNKMRTFLRLFKRPFIVDYYNEVAGRYQAKTEDGGKRACLAPELLQYIERLCAGTSIAPGNLRFSGLAQFPRYLDIYDGKTRRARARKTMGVTMPFRETWDQGVEEAEKWTVWMDTLPDIHRTLLIARTSTKDSDNNSDDDEDEDNTGADDATTEDDSSADESRDDTQTTKRLRRTADEHSSSITRDPDSVPSSAIRFNPTLPLTSENTEDASAGATTATTTTATVTAAPAAYEGLPKDAIIAELRNQMVESRRDLCEQAATITRLTLTNRELTERIANLEREKRSNLKNSREYATMKACNEHFKRFLIAYNNELLAYNPSAKIIKMRTCTTAQTQAQVRAHGPPCKSSPPASPLQYEHREHDNDNHGTARHEQQHEQRPRSPINIDQLPTVNPQLVQQFQQEQQQEQPQPQNDPILPMPSNMTLHDGGSGNSVRDAPIPLVYNTHNANTNTRFDAILGIANEFIPDEYTQSNLLDESENEHEYNVLQ